MTDNPYISLVDALVEAARIAADLALENKDHQTTLIAVEVIRLVAEAHKAAEDYAQMQAP